MRQLPEPWPLIPSSALRQLGPVPCSVSAWHLHEASSCARAWGPTPGTFPENEKVEEASMPRRSSFCRPQGSRKPLRQAAFLSRFTPQCWASGQSSEWKNCISESTKPTKTGHDTAD